MMSRIPKARKEAVLSKMLSPNPPTISALAKQEGISEATLYNWRKQLRQEGRPVPEHDRTSENWSAQTKLASWQQSWYSEAFWHSDVRPHPWCCTQTTVHR
jgi:transposase-like protein